MIAATLSAALASMVAGVPAREAVAVQQAQQVQSELTSFGTRQLQAESMAAQTQQAEYGFEPTEAPHKELELMLLQT